MDTNEVLKAFEEYHQSSKDSMTDIHKRMDAIEARGNRLNLINGSAPSDGQIITPEQAEHANAFYNWARKGAREAELHSLEAKAFQNTWQTGSDTDGGYGVPVQIDRNIEKIVRNSVAMRQLANVITGSAGYNRLVNMNNTASGWVGETEARTETGTPNLKKLTPFFGELYASPAITQTALDDVFFDVENFLVESISDEFSSKEGAAFITGNGIKSPKGILAFTTSALADGVRNFGEIQYIVSGDANGFPTVTDTFSPYDVLLDVVGSIKAAYRQNASFLMNKKTLTALRKIKTASTGEYVIEPATATAPATIWGYPIFEDENMPDIGAGAFPIAFGDFKRAYTIVDVTGPRLLRDPYSNKPFVSFYTTKRVGSFLNNSEAVKLLKISA